jgi:hypothetical protein
MGTRTEQLSGTSMQAYADEVGSNDSVAAERREVDRTRERLGNNIDLLVEKVSPSAIAERKVGAVKQRFGRVKERVMGVTPAAGDVVDASSEQVRSHPLALGVVAFGVGWLASAMLPMSEAEKKVAASAADAASRAGVTDELSTAVKEVGTGIKESVQESTTAVKESASEAVADVRDRTVDLTSGASAG